MPRRCVPDLFSWGHFRRGHRQDFCLHVFFTITVVPEARVTTVWTQAIAAELHVTSQYHTGLWLRTGCVTNAQVSVFERTGF